MNTAATISHGTLQDRDASLRSGMIAMKNKPAALRYLFPAQMLSGEVSGCG
jgi:hypothetical protein